MNTRSSRLIEVKDLPESLWLPDEGVLCLSPQLIQTWISLLEKHNLRSRADKPRPDKGPTGGITQVAAEDHLAWSFTGSASRVQLAMLDPKCELPNIADAFSKFFSGGKVAIVDLPCGAMAANLSLLCTLAELRYQSLVPRGPLDVVLLGGEINEWAREQASDALELARPALEKQAIFVEEKILEWDVCNSISNTDLIQEFTIQSQNCGAKLLMLANFSGFLHRENKWKDAKSQLDELFRHCRSEKSTVFWIEPGSNNASEVQGDFFSRVSNWLNSAKWMKRLFSDYSNENNGSAVLKSNFKVQHPLANKNMFNASLSVKRFDLPSRQ